MIKNFLYRTFPFTFIASLFLNLAAQDNDFNKYENGLSQNDSTLSEEQQLILDSLEISIVELKTNIARYSNVKEGGAIVLGGGIIVSVIGFNIARAGAKKNSDAVNSNPPDLDEKERTEKLINFGTFCTVTGLSVTIGGIVVNTIGSIKCRIFKRKQDKVENEKMNLLIKGNSLVFQYNF